MHKDLSRRFWIVLLSILVMTVVAMYVSLTNGVFDLTVRDVFQAVLRKNPQWEHDLVIFDFRLPRIVIAALVGMALGVAGAVIQGITRNGLADPGILGINAGAGLAIVLFMFFFETLDMGNVWFSVMAMPLFGLVGGLGAAAIIYFFSWQQGRLDPQRLILTGIGIASGFGALALFISLKMKPTDFEMATVWLTGSIWNANWEFVLSMLPWLALLLPIIMMKSYILDLFQLGEDSVKSLGVSVEKEKNILLISSIGLVSACVSVSGNIGFIGLMAPHIARRLVGTRHQNMLPISGVVGMLLVIISDFIARTLFSPIELPVGIVISILGVPYFMYLLLKAKA